MGFVIVVVAVDDAAVTLAGSVFVSIFLVLGSCFCVCL